MCLPSVLPHRPVHGHTHAHAHPARLVSDQKRPWPSVVVTIQPVAILRPILGLGLCPQYLGLSVASPAGAEGGPWWSWTAGWGHFLPPKITGSGCS